MKHTFIAHLTFDTGSADPDALKDEVADAIGPVVEAQLRMLQHHYAGHDMPVTVTVYEVQDADELAHQLALLHGALAEAKAKRACSLPSVLVDRIDEQLDSGVRLPRPQRESGAS